MILILKAVFFDMSGYSACYWEHQSIAGTFFLPQNYIVHVFSITELQYNEFIAIGIPHSSL